jgi:hypothetical protein
MLDAAMIPLTDSVIELMKLLIVLTAIAVMLMMGVTLRHSWAQARRRFLNLPIFSGAVIKATFPSAVVMILYRLSGVLGILGGIWLALPLMSRPILRVALGTVVIVLMGSVLFWVKLKQLRYYALIEGAFALGVCIQTLVGFSDYISPAQVAGLFAAAYLFIRAADNFHKDLEKREADKRWIVDELREQNPGVEFEWSRKPDQKWWQRLFTPSSKPIALEGSDLRLREVPAKERDANE